MPASPPRPKKSSKRDPLAERPGLDFSKGVRGKYTNLLAKGTNVAIIDPALYDYFPDHTIYIRQRPPNSSCPS